MRRRESLYTCVFLKLDFVAVGRCCVVESSPKWFNNAIFAMKKQHFWLVLLAAFAFLGFLGTRKGLWDRIASGSWERSVAGHPGNQAPQPKAAAILVWRSL
jgi:hypothetical protein